MKLIESVRDLLADGRARTAEEIAEELGRKLKRRSETIATYFRKDCANDPALARRVRPKVAAAGRAPFEYFLPSERQPIVATARAVLDLRAAIFDVLSGAGYLAQEEIVAAVARKTGVGADEIRIRLVGMTARGEIERAHYYRAPKRK